MPPEYEDLLKAGTPGPFTARNELLPLVEIPPNEWSALVERSRPRYQCGKSIRTVFVDLTAFKRDPFGQPIPR
jgi:hypothetical protein